MAARVQKIFQSGVLRKIFWSMTEDVIGDWRKLRNEE
jgi:hypothetical protein